MIVPAEPMARCAGVVVFGAAFSLGLLFIPVWFLRAIRRGRLRTRFTGAPSYLLEFLAQCLKLFLERFHPLLEPLGLSELLAIALVPISRPLGFGVVRREVEF